ncbi:MAG: hypothetical protein KDC36_12275, partial [Thermoleophilia bacterium]|nr:hypothetical protein [Thermoleophilia bacterium]
MPSGHPNVAPPTRKGLVGRALATVRRDINAVLERDPAPRSKAEVLMYQGLHAIWMHRLAHRLYVRGAVFP